MTSSDTMNDPRCPECNRTDVEHRSDPTCKCGWHTCIDEGCPNVNIPHVCISSPSDVTTQTSNPVIVFATSPKTFIVGYMDSFDNEMILERVEAPSWREAVTQHSKFPWSKEDLAEESDRGELFCTGATEEAQQEHFRQRCFDVDCMMNWLEL